MSVILQRLQGSAEENIKKTMMAANLAVIVCALTQRIATIPLSDEFINQINSKQTSWTAGRNFPIHTSVKHIEKLMGTLKYDYAEKLQKLKHGADFIAGLPKTFDPKKKWPECPSLSEIRDQGLCSSCWAFGAVEAMTDRYCIFSNQTEEFHFSAEDLISCCEICGEGCMKGVHTAAWRYWKRVGLVSGGNYNSKHGCRSYSMPPGLNKVMDDFSHSLQPGCIQTCDSKNIDYRKDKRMGKTVYSIDANEGQIKAELFKNGPVEGVMAVYTDFLNYKNGVYIHTEGHLLGHHAVKILGWGEERGLKYWSVANSWGQNWGDSGFFNILRGKNHCGIEDSIVAGEPIID